MTTTSRPPVDRVQRVLDLPLHRWLGLQLAEPDDPRGGVVLGVTASSLDAAGLLHSGLVTALLDVAASLRLLPELADDEEAVTHDSSMSLLRPIRAGEQLTFCADLLCKDDRRAFLRSVGCTSDETVAMGQATKSLLRVP